MAAETRVWLVERTYSDDEQNLIILTYATADGRQDFRKERALTSFSGDHRETSVSRCRPAILVPSTTPTPVTAT